VKTDQEPAPSLKKREKTINQPVPGKKLWLPPWLIGLVGLVVVGLLINWLANGNSHTALFSTQTAAPINSTYPPEVSTLLPLPSESSTLPTSTQTPIIPDEITDAKGVPMRLVPYGEFTMGLSADTAYVECQKLSIGGTCDRAWFTDKEPAHTVTLDSFYMDKFEVSNAAYRQCVSNGSCQPPSDKSSANQTYYYGNADYDNYPVIHLDWNQAMAYCSWREARLPTEAEWEKAARGSDGRLYPWGNPFDGTRANFCDKNCSYSWANNKFNDGYAGTAPVDSFPSGVSVYGIFNLAGNAHEWTSSLYQPYPYSASDGREDLLTSGFRVLRGGSWFDQGSALLSALRIGDDPTDSILSFGVRCARGISP